MGEQAIEHGIISALLKTARCSVCSVFLIVGGGDGDGDGDGDWEDVCGEYVCGDDSCGGSGSELVNK